MAEAQTLARPYARAAFEVAHEASGAIQPRPRLMAERMRDESPGRQRRSLEVSARQPAASEVKLADHADRFYPESMMSVNFNLWFIRDGMTKEQGERSYQEDIDWVFHEARSALTPDEIEARVAALRSAKVSFRDTVPAPKPVLASPCNF